MKNKTSFLSLLILMSYSTWLGCGSSGEALDEEAAAAVPETEMPQLGDTVLVPAGEFIMGTEQEAPPPLAGPERTIDLPAYYIDVYEVTHGEWIRFLTVT